MKLRCQHRLYPSTLQQRKLAKLLITEAKKTPERARLGGVSAVVPLASLCDLGPACSHFFPSKRGTRRDPKTGLPRFKKAARFSITEKGRPRLPKTGDVRVRCSRELPSAPSSVTIIKDAAGHPFASFVIEVENEPLPELEWAATDPGIDLGLSSYAVLRARKIAAPRFFRHLEKRLRRDFMGTCECGTAHDRDRNAEHNPRAEGRPDTRNTRGAHVTPGKPGGGR